MTTSPSELPPLFPFSAIAGQPELRLALLLAALDPRIGGVLVEGPRGTAKSTGARALAELLPSAPFVTLPLGATLEHLVGTLDLQQALAGNAVRFAPGLLARAHGGVLYVDEINLLPDALVDVLLDAAASGVNVIERDGISHSHPARFVLVGTMNPEEGTLRPQLLDRLGLCVRLDNVSDVALRQSIVRARLAFDADPHAFRARYADEQQQLSHRLQSAMHRLNDANAWPLTDDALQTASELCIEAHVDGMRADLVLLRAARAFAAWNDAKELLPEHVHAVSDLVLAHRRKPSAAAQSQSMQQQAKPPSSASSRNDGTDTTSQHNDADNDWGYLPPQPVPVQRSTDALQLLPRRAGEPTQKKA
ncbi:AAA domain-containing protein [Diaphorobacter sp. HDW4B]|uniref:ATP-binding protein n=1 Tax=Diaphorobacter sp. HDW4B TaxID=2714925 RepID=UPI0014084F43|nr:ATP-binding protein [Diaphorobacter sp. HDW4B]QIL70783.1 AAA domain-containing protein [Diaphorobacter sp. HDW4B]